MKDETLEEGNRNPRATGRPGPIPHPHYCAPQCYNGKPELAKACECKGCGGDAHGRGRKYAFDHGYLKLSPPGSRKPPANQELLFLDDVENPAEQNRSISVTRSNEIRWTPVPRPKHVDPDETVWISVIKLDASWTKNSQYIGPGGSGPAIGDRYQKFGIWLERGEPVWIPWVGLEDGEVCFTDGRHRFAWFRDHGVKSMPIDVDPAIAYEIRKRFGAIGRSSLCRNLNG
jgi:hypothetical protein